MRINVNSCISDKLLSMNTNLLKKSSSSSEKKVGVGVCVWGGGAVDLRGDMVNNERNGAKTRRQKRRWSNEDDLVGSEN